MAREAILSHERTARTPQQPTITELVTGLAAARPAESAQQPNTMHADTGAASRRDWRGKASAIPMWGEDD